ncbi:MAG: IS21-like element helper ATPase IstB [Bacteroidales bacterium]|nr:IS21-like element helper ATPase IstB [Bacteroidales bacterium]
MQTLAQLTSLRLHGMARVWQSLQETRQLHQTSLEEGIQLMLQSEEQERVNRRSNRLTKNARFRYQASLEEIHANSSRGLEKALITQLATGEYINQGQAVLITGATGCGKSFLASALGHHACVQGYKVAYYNLQKLLIKTKMARVDGSIYKLLEQISKTDLLILDDFGLTHLEYQQQMDIMEIIEDRHAKKATIIASQLPVASWYDVIGEETIADAILDRLVHSSFRVELKGDSLRKKL